MDRNPVGFWAKITITVALRKESVDRNPVRMDAGNITCPSLSARRAWIEIPGCVLSLRGHLQSLSARRAWIEMCFLRSPFATFRSLSARRAWIEMH